MLECGPPHPAAPGDFSGQTIPAHAQSVRDFLRQEGMLKTQPGKRVFKFCSYRQLFYFGVIYFNGHISPSLGDRSPFCPSVCFLPLFLFYKFLFFFIWKGGRVQALAINEYMPLTTWTMPGPTLAYMANIERAGAPNPVTNPEGIIVEGDCNDHFIVSCLSESKFY